MAANPSQSMDWGTAATAVADVRNSAGAIETTGTGIQTNVITLMSNGWTGNASVAYESAYQTWHKGLVQIQENLVWLSDQMESTNTAAEDNETELGNTNAAFDAPEVAAY
ncbi:MAG: WXG100 family type VII secretion target [Angustibacter sp.]